MNHVDKLKNLILNKSNSVNSNPAARNSVVDEFCKCSQKQSEIILETWKKLKKLYGKPDCVKYSGNKREHVIGIAPFSLHCECIRFRDNENQILIRLARSTTPGCQLRDPILVYKYSDNRPKRLLILKSLTETSDFLSDIATNINKISEFEIAPHSVPRKASSSGMMTFKEKDLLLPAFLSTKQVSKYKHQIEYKHPHGFVDVYLNSGKQHIYVELKYIEESENPITKLRTAIGQILMYQNDPKSKHPDCDMWIVINEIKLDLQLRKAIQKITYKTKINFFCIDNLQLKEI